MCNEGYMIIDIHTHIYNKKTYQEYLSKAKDRIIKVLVLHWYKFNLEELISSINTMDKLYVIGGVDMSKNIQEQLKKLEKFFLEKKIFGIKLYPGYQYFYPSQRTVNPVAKLCEKFNKPLIFHSGDVYDPEGTAVLKYSHPIYIDELAVKFPKTKIVIAHFGFPYLLETANVVFKNPNVYTDISATITETDTPKEAKGLFKQYLQDLLRVFAYFPEVKKKLMFGTDYGGEDCPLNQVEPYINLVKQIASQDEQNQIFYQTAENLFFG